MELHIKEFNTETSDGMKSAIMFEKITQIIN